MKKPIQTRLLIVCLNLLSQPRRIFAITLKMILNYHGISTCKPSRCNNVVLYIFQISFSTWFVSWWSTFLSFLFLHTTSLHFNLLAVEVRFTKIIRTTYTMKLIWQCSILHKNLVYGCFTGGSKWNDYFSIKM